MIAYIIAAFIGLVIAALIFIKTRGKYVFAVLAFLAPIVAVFAWNNIPSSAPTETAAAEPPLRAATPTPESVAKVPEAGVFEADKALETKLDVAKTLTSATQNGTALEGATFARSEDGLWRVSIPARSEPRTVLDPETKKMVQGTATYEARSMRLAANAGNIFARDGVYDIILLGEKDDQGSGTVGYASVKILDDGKAQVTLFFDCQDNRQFFGDAKAEGGIVFNLSNEASK